jgi:hypothetical protein
MTTRSLLIRETTRHRYDELSGAAAQLLTTRKGLPQRMRARGAPNAAAGRREAMLLSAAACVARGHGAGGDPPAALACSYDTTATPSSPSDW